MKTLTPLLAEAAESLTNTGVFSLLGGLADEILAKSKQEALDDGEILFRQGDIGNCAYIVLEGELDVEVDMGFGLVKVATVVKNQLIGEIAVFSQVPRTATARAKGKASLLRLEGADILALLETSPSVGRAIISDLGRRLAMVNQPLAFFFLAAQALRREDFSSEMLSDMASRTEELGPFARALQEMVSEIEAKHLRRQEMEMARCIQQSVLPKPLPEDAKLPVALSAFMRPAREVGGDLYDYFLIDKGHLAVVIADVCGKGVPASLLMVMSRTVLRSVVGMGLAVDQCLNRLNAVLTEDNDLGFFVTLFLGIINLDTGGLTYCNAGHNPPYLLRAAGEVELLVPTGPAVAIMPNASFRVAEVTLEKGDLLFLFTDGVTEAHSAGQELFGEARLASLLKGQRGESPTKAIAAVVEEVDRFAAGTEQFDDITCLALQALDTF